MFHCLAGAAADLLIGRTRGPAWHRVYRTLGHGAAGNACRQKQEMERFPPEIRNFASTFATLQRERHQADYALDGGPYYKVDVLAKVDAAEFTIKQFGQADIRHRRAFAAHALFRPRPS